MKKFLVIYKAPNEDIQKAMATTTPEERKASMGEWMAWMTAHKANIVDNGAPLGKTKQIKAGSISDIKNDIGGYSIVQAETHDEAAKLFSDSPHAKMSPNASMEVMEIVTMPGM